MRLGPGLFTLLLAIGTAAPLAAQARSLPSPEPAPALAVRPFFLFTEERFTAFETFDAVFGGSVKPFLGGGAQLAFRSGLYADVTVSRFSSSGDRVFSFNGETFHLGIPLTATIVPIEVTGGYRFGAASGRSVVPYVGAGVGSYRYTETADFAGTGDDVSQRGSGYLAVAGAEFRVYRRIVASADVQYTRVGGILGTGGVSQQVGENTLGGVAARFRVIIGR